MLIDRNLYAERNSTNVYLQRFWSEYSRSCNKKVNNMLTLLNICMSSFLACSLLIVFYVKSIGELDRCVDHMTGNLFLYYLKQVYSILQCVCSVRMWLSYKFVKTWVLKLWLNTFTPTQYMDLVTMFTSLLLPSSSDHKIKKKKLYTNAVKGFHIKVN